MINFRCDLGKERISELESSIGVFLFVGYEIAFIVLIVNFVLCPSVLDSYVPEEDWHVYWFHGIYMLIGDKKKDQVKICTNKASEGNGIPVELFQILNYDAI